LFFEQIRSGDVSTFNGGVKSFGGVFWISFGGVVHSFVTITAVGFPDIFTGSEYAGRFTGGGGGSSSSSSDDSSGSAFRCNY